MEDQTNNMALYEQARSVPEEAKKTITGGELKGYTNVNPMYRIKRLTELFGPCGVGWWYEIVNQRLERVNDTPEVMCFVDINLYYRWNGEVSKPIPGIGGNKFVSSTKNGFQASDECFKKSLTDAISVASKALGIAGDVFWVEDRDSKYVDTSNGPEFYGNGYQTQQPIPQTAPQLQQQYAPQQPQYQQPPQYNPPRSAAKSNAAPMSVDDARRFVIPCGGCKGKTLAEVIPVNPGLIDYFTRCDESFRKRYPDFVRACEILKSA